MKILRIVFDKYLITAAAFIVFIVFFDQNDLHSQRERQQDLKNVKANISMYKEDIARMNSDYRALTTNPDELERYAREHYRMKRDSEDVYVVEKK